MSQTSIDVSWDPPSNTGSSEIQGYEVYCLLPNGQDFTTQTSAIARTASFTPLRPALTASFQIRAWNLDLTGAYSSCTGTTSYFTDDVIYFEFSPHTGGTDIWEQFDPLNPMFISRTTANNPQRYVVLGSNAGVDFNRVDFEWEIPYTSIASYTDDTDPLPQAVIHGQDGTTIGISSSMETTSLETIPLEFSMFGKESGSGSWAVTSSLVATGTDHLSSLFNDVNNFVTSSGYSTRRWMILKGPFNDYEGNMVNITFVSTSLA